MRRITRAVSVLAIAAAIFGQGAAAAGGIAPASGKSLPLSDLHPSADAFAESRHQLAATPPMGWNSWNAFGRNIDENLIKGEARALITSGLAAAGYDTVVVDGGWRAPTRDANGNMQADPTRFPHGMKALADYVHGLGLKFGLHQPVGMTDCGGNTPGTQSAPGGEKQDADTFASWSVDYLKYDLCKYQYPADAAPGAPDIDALTVSSDKWTNRPYEAEGGSNVLGGAARLEPCAACSGGAAVTAIGLRDGTLTFRNVTVPATGEYTLGIRYVHVDHSDNRITSELRRSRMALVSVDGGAPTQTWYPVPRTPDGDVTGWGTTDTLHVTVHLHRGRNTITFSDPNSWEEMTRTAYQRIADAIRQSGRPMVLSISEYGMTRPWLWAPGIGQLWRTTGDLGDFWDERPAGYAGHGGNSIAHALDKQVGLDSYAGPGRWNDPDMLQVGNGYTTAAEDRSHFSLWAMLAAPLNIGTDLTSMTPETLSILSNRDVIAVDQDPLGVEGHKSRDDGDDEVWVKPLSDGSSAVLLVNRAADVATITVRMTDIGLRRAPSYRVRDLWAHHTDRSSGTLTGTVAAHGVEMYRVWPR